MGSHTPPEGKVDPSVDMKTAVRNQVNRLDAKEYFTLLAQLMKTNPPSTADASALDRFAKIGLVPSKDFDASKLNADFVKHIPQFGLDRIMLQLKTNRNVKHINGWAFTTKTGIYGTDYLMRALVTVIGLARTDHRTPFIRPRARMRMTKITMGRTNTSCALRRGRPRPQRDFGR